MSKEEDKELVSKLLKVSNEIHKKRLGQKNYIHLSQNSYNNDRRRRCNI